MAEETKKTPQTPEEIAREAQAQAMKAALEQAQALYGNVPGFEGTDLMKMHEKLMQDSAEMFPGVAEAQAYQAKMMAESAQDPEAIMETYSKNIEFAGNMMQQAMNAGFMPEGLPDFSDGFDVYAGWEITRKGDNSLTPEQNRLLAYGAPLFLYNDDNVDSLESTAGTDTLKEMLEEWWEVTDRKSALETISWLLNEGQHAGAVPADILFSLAAAYAFIVGFALRREPFPAPAIDPVPAVLVQVAAELRLAAGRVFRCLRHRPYDLPVRLEGLLRGA